jgi:hypothetical protein
MASSSTKAEVKQFTATFSFASDHLTTARLGAPLEACDYNSATSAYTSDTNVLTHDQLVVPVGGHIINGTDSNQRIGNRIHVNHFRLKALIKNTSDCAPCLKLSLISDVGLNGNIVVDPKDIYELDNNGNVCNTIPKLSTSGRYAVLKCSVFETYVEKTDSTSYLCWDLTMAMPLIYRGGVDSYDDAGFASQNTGLYLLVSVGTDSKCTLQGTYSLLYTDS